jgi:uncharacterized membrane protein YpjA
MREHFSSVCQNNDDIQLINHFHYSLIISFLKYGIWNQVIKLKEFLNQCNFTVEFEDWNVIHSNMCVFSYLLKPSFNKPSDRINTQNILSEDEEK